MQLLRQVAARAALRRQSMDRFRGIVTTALRHPRLTGTTKTGVTRTSLTSQRWSSSSASNAGDPNAKKELYTGIAVMGGFFVVGVLTSVDLLTSKEEQEEDGWLTEEEFARYEEMRNSKEIRGEVK